MKTDSTAQRRAITSSAVISAVLRLFGALAIGAQRLASARCAGPVRACRPAASGWCCSRSGRRDRSRGAQATAHSTAPLPSLVLDAAGEGARRDGRGLADLARQEVRAGRREISACLRPGVSSLISDGIAFPADFDAAEEIGLGLAPCGRAVRGEKCVSSPKIFASGLKRDDGAAPVAPRPGPSACRRAGRARSACL